MAAASCPQVAVARTDRDPLRRVLVVSFLVFTSYQFALTLVPYVLARSGSPDLTVGGVTAALMLAATVGPLLVRRVLAPERLTRTLCWSLAMLAGATFAAGLPASTAVLYGSAAVRGIAFGLLAAGLAIAAARYAPADARGRSLGLWGTMCSAPSVFAPTVAVLAAERISLLVLLGLASALTLGALWPTRRLPTLTADGAARHDASHAVHPGTSVWKLLARPTLVFLWAIGAYGAVVTFAPAYLSGTDGTDSIHSSIAFVLAMGIMVPLGRLFGGTAPCHARPSRAVAAGCLLVAIALAAMLATCDSGLVLLAGGAFGLGIGMLGTVFHLVTLRLAGPGGVANASLVFSSAYNAGIGLGGLAMGFLGAAVGMTAGFMVWAVGAAIAAPLGALAARGANPSRPRRP